MRILVDIASLNGGGAERQVVQLCAGLAARGSDVLLVVNKSIGAFERELTQASLGVIELQKRARWDPRVLRDIMTVLRAFRPDCVLCVNFNATLWGRGAASLAGVPMIAAEHATRERTPLRERATNRLFSKFTFSTVACAEHQVDALAMGGVPRERITVIRNAVDTGGTETGSGRRQRAPSSSWTSQGHVRGGVSCRTSPGEAS